MEKILKPEKLTIEATTVGAEAKWIHWKKRFTIFLNHIQAKTDESKLQILYSCVSTNIFAMISDCERYEAAIAILDSQYLMRTMSIAQVQPAANLTRQSFARMTQQFGRGTDGDHLLLLKLKGVEDNLNNKMVEIAQLKKKLQESASVIKQERNALRMMENKKIAIAHKVTIFEGQIEDLKEEKKLMVSLVEELRAELSLKESAITKKELALRKIQTQKDCLQEDVQRWQDANRESRKTANILQENLKDARNFLKEREFDIEKLTIDNKHLITGRDIAKQQLKKVKEQNKRLNLKFKSLQKLFYTEKTHYADRVEDIRLLKLDCDNLRKEKCKLVEIIENTADHQSTIYNLERDLLKERLKARTLEEELEKPINIHRWRKLEGTDPSKMELHQKNDILQKKLLKEVSANYGKGEKLKEVQLKCEDLNQLLNFEKENNPNLAEKLSKTQNDLREKTASLKLLKTKVKCLGSQNSKMKQTLDIALKKLHEFEKLQLEQKKQAMKQSSSNNSEKIEPTAVEDNTISATVFEFE